MDAETKKMWLGIIYGAGIIIAVIIGIVTQDLVLTGTQMTIISIVLLFADNTIRKIMKQYGGFTDEELDDIKKDIVPLNDSEEPKPEPEPKPIGTTPPG